MIAKRPPTRGLSLAVGLAALVFSVLYLVSDLVELIQGGFSTGQPATRPARTTISSGTRETDKRSTPTSTC